MNPSNEPLWALAAMQVVTYLAGHFGLNLDATTQAAINGVVLAIGTYIARKFVTPTAKAAA
jgi:hypothetical protein